MERVALIVGGGSGIGAASARLLAHNGFTIAVADIALSSAEASVTMLPSGGHRPYAANISSEREISALFDKVEAEVGAVAALVIAAGVNGSVNGVRPTIRQTEADNWDSVMAVNVRGPFLCVREMFKRREVAPIDDARVVLIGSMSSQTLSVNSPPAYVASKGALAAFAKAAAGEGASLGITVNVVAPGAIDTPMLRKAMPKEKDAFYFSTTVAKRAGLPDEVGEVVAFLISPAASYINGACIDVNGGMFMR